MSWQAAKADCQKAVQAQWTSEYEDIPSLHLDFGPVRQRSLLWGALCFLTIGAARVQADLPLSAGAVPLPRKGHRGARSAAGHPCWCHARALGHGALCHCRPPRQRLLASGLGVYRHITIRLVI